MELKNRESLELTMPKSPIDEFNLQITRQTEWGKSHYGSGANFGTLQ